MCDLLMTSTMKLNYYISLFYNHGITFGIISMISLLLAIIIVTLGSSTKHARLWNVCGICMAIIFCISACNFIVDSPNFVNTKYSSTPKFASTYDINVKHNLNQLHRNQQQLKHVHNHNYRLYLNIEIAKRAHYNYTHIAHIKHPLINHKL